MAPPPLIRENNFMAIVGRILSTRPAASAHKVGGEWKSYESHTPRPHRVYKRMHWFELPTGAKLEPPEENPADTEPATKKRPAAKAAAAARTKAKTLILKRPAAVHRHSIPTTKRQPGNSGRESMV